MASVFDLSPCGSPANMVTSIIQTRIFTTTGPMPIDCTGVDNPDPATSCNVWGHALGSLSAAHCPPAPVTP